MTTAIGGGVLSPPKRKRYFFAVELVDSNAIIGDAGFAIKIKNGHGGIAELGYFFYKSYWGCGYGSEAVAILTAYIFGQTNLHKVIACCDKRNVASERVMQKCGMMKEGENRMGRLQQGYWCTELTYGILKEEWMSNHEPMDISLDQR